MNPSSTVPDKVKGIHWNLAQQKNAGQSIIALLLAKSNVRNDKEHSAPVLWQSYLMKTDGGIGCQLGCWKSH